MLVKRRLFTIISALSLVLCVNELALGAGDSVAANDHDIFSFYCKSLHARFTLRANAAQIGLYGPPLAGSNFAKTHIAPARVRQVLNTPVEWSIYRMEDDPAPDAPGFFWVERENVSQSLLDALFPPPTRETIPALLDAMEAPEKFVSAHWLLTRESIQFEAPEPPAEKDAVTRQPDGSFLYVRDGLHLELSHLKQTAWGAAVGGPIVVYSCQMSVDPNQYRPLLDRWHRRLDKPIVVVPYSQFITGAALLLLGGCVPGF